eukprot:6195492-Pleurochrysis_carterae.AAC.6
MATTRARPLAPPSCARALATLRCHVPRSRGGASLPRPGPVGVITPASKLATATIGFAVLNVNASWPGASAVVQPLYAPARQSFACYLPGAAGRHAAAMPARPARQVARPIAEIDVVAIGII